MTSIEIMHDSHKWYECQWPWVSIIWLLYNLQPDAMTGADFEKFIVCFQLIRKEIASLMCGTDNNLSCFPTIGRPVKSSLQYLWYGNSKCSLCSSEQFKLSNFCRVVDCYGSCPCNMSTSPLFTNSWSALDWLVIFVTTLPLKECLDWLFSLGESCWSDTKNAKWGPRLYM